MASHGLRSLGVPWLAKLWDVKITIDPASPDHPYVQVATQLRQGIASGEVGPLLPSIMELTEETGLAVNTVRRAIRILINEGLAYTVPGRGTFVGQPARRRPGD
jgi:GntR family transcriptional regulator